MFKYRLADIQSVFFTPLHWHFLWMEKNIVANEVWFCVGPFHIVFEKTKDI